MKRNIISKTRKRAVAYFRTSSAANVGGDSDVRQRVAVNEFAKQNAVVIDQEFYDAAVSGADPLESRPGFRDLLSFIDSNPDCKTILVEQASRFARDLMVQEIGFSKLKELGIELIAVDSPASFIDDDAPTIKLLRQILGAVTEFDKCVTVSKLKAARDRKREATGKCEGRKTMVETYPEAVKLAKKLNSKRKRKLSLRKISAALAEQGFMSRISGNPFSAKSIQTMLKVKSA